MLKRENDKLEHSRIKKEAFELKNQRLILKRENKKLERSITKKEKVLKVKPKVSKIKYLYKKFFDSTEELCFSSINEIIITLGLEKNYVRSCLERGSVNRDFIKKVNGEYKFKLGVKRMVRRIDKNREKRYMNP